MPPERQKNLLFFADSRELGSFLQKDYFDLILTGPPYSNEVVYSDDSGQLSAQKDYKSFLSDIERVWQGCQKTLKPGGIMALWVHDFFRDDRTRNYVPFHSDILATLKPYLTLRNMIIWDRYLHRNKGPIPRQRPLGTRLQYILILQKDGRHPANHDLIESSIARYFWQPVWNKKTHPKFLGSGFLFQISHFFGRLLPSIFDPIRSKINSSPIIRDKHTFSTYLTECPEEVAEKLIRDFSRPGDKILDPFLGSGTTMKVAARLKRQCVGVEINKQALSAIEEKVGRDNFKIVT